MYQLTDTTCPYTTFTSLYVFIFRPMKWYRYYVRVYRMAMPSTDILWWVLSEYIAAHFFFVLRKYKIVKGSCTTTCIYIYTHMANLWVSYMYILRLKRGDISHWKSQNQKSVYLYCYQSSLFKFIFAFVVVVFNMY